MRPVFYIEPPWKALRRKPGHALPADLTVFTSVRAAWDAYLTQEAREVWNLYKRRLVVGISSICLDEMKSIAEEHAVVQTFPVDPETLLPSHWEQDKLAELDVFLQVEAFGFETDSEPFDDFLSLRGVQLFVDAAQCGLPLVQKTRGTVATSFGPLKHPTALGGAVTQLFGRQQGDEGDAFERVQNAWPLENPSKLAVRAARYSALAVGQKSIVYPVVERVLLAAGLDSQRVIRNWTKGKRPGGTERLRTQPSAGTKKRVHAAITSKSSMVACDDRWAAGEYISRRGRLCSFGRLAKSRRYYLLPIHVRDPQTCEQDLRAAGFAPVSVAGLDVDPEDKRCTQRFRETVFFPCDQSLTWEQIVELGKIAGKHANTRGLP